MKPLELEKRWVLVTGASSGLGREMARVLARDFKSNLIIVARRQERLAQLASELEEAHGVSVRAVTADLSRDGEADRVFDEATQGGLIGAILNAGVTHFGNWDELSWEDFQRMHALNVTSVVRMTTLLLPYLEKRAEGGGLLLVSSMAGLMPVPYQTAYSATKGFLVNFGCGLHHEMLPRGVSVTTFVPGGIRTEMTDGERFNDLRGWLMPVDRCASEAVRALRERAYLHSPGMMYRLGSVVSRLLPQRFFIGRVAEQYRRSLERHRGSRAP
ncbi:MAG TPA: SDR family NAD(P)-dependent oxidoreductase [Polyangiaceae bacterium]|nr:SDR family NAD(P)-dependent oxidoreductase [Polyangiaceae bacterium]